MTRSALDRKIKLIEKFIFNKLKGSDINKCVVIPVSEAWGFYKDDDSDGHNEWAVHLTCRSKKEIIYWFPIAGRNREGIDYRKSKSCWRCNGRPSKNVMSKLLVLKTMNELVNRSNGNG